MHVLIVRLSSLGDIAHALPVVRDIRDAHPGAAIDWAVDASFAPLLRRVDGLRTVIELPLRRWRDDGFGRQGWVEGRDALRTLRQRRYDAVIDLQGLTKSALVARCARGRRFGLANRTEGSSFEAPARWLVDQALRVAPRIHALDRSRELAARALGYAHAPRPDHGLRVPSPRVEDGPTLLFAHGASRADKLWREAAWIALGQRAIDHGWRIALPRHGAADADRARRIAAALPGHAEVWPEMQLDALVDRMAALQGVVGVDSGLSHLAVALRLPHVQIYQRPTAWRTGPLPAHGHSHQVAVSGEPCAVDDVWSAWRAVSADARLAV